MPYQVRKNKLNDCKYIVLKQGNKCYKVQKLNNTDVYIWIDNSVLNDYQNLQLLKIIKYDCNKNDFETLFNIATNYLKRIKHHETIINKRLC